jgi:hypothetical protein
MHELEQILQIQETAEQIISRITEAGGRVWADDNKAYLDLVDQFYVLNVDLMAPEQYEAAKVDVEYFMRLITLAVAHWEKEGEKSK